jgi:steroid 5-alpha reductase family enzyme
MLTQIAENLAVSALFILAYVTAWFAVSLALHRNDVADVAWGLGPTLLAWWLVLRTGSPRTPALLVAAVLITVWGVRLAWHIAKRDFRPGAGEDARYAAWRAEWRYFTLRSYLQVFLLQGFFMLLVSTPVIILASWPVAGGAIALGVGAAVWLGGFAFEAIGDRQLAAYLETPREERPPVMDTGLWAWTRHPNYFGESVMWWGLALIGLSAPYGWIGLISPVVITWLLVAVSGIPLVEQRHYGDPAWDDYRARTSAFLPRPPARR